MEYLRTKVQQLFVFSFILTLFLGGNLYAQTESFSIKNSSGENQLYINSDGKVGIDTSTTLGTLTVNGLDGIIATGTYGSGTTLNLGAGTRLMWYPKKGAFRVGRVLENEWDDANVGNLSIAMGSNTISSGIISTSMGLNTTASGDYSTALGWSNVASGKASLVNGYFSSASGNYSTALGSNIYASGDNSIAMGYISQASGNISIAIGYYTKAIGRISTAIGDSTTANGYASFSGGFRTTASGNYSTALGHGTTASSDYSTALGYNTLAASHLGATAIGGITSATGYWSTAMGNQTTASGDYSTAMGWHTIASGNNSTAMGHWTAASGDYSTAIGNYVNTNTHIGSVVIGDNSTTSTLNANDDNRFLSRFATGYNLYTNSAMTVGATLGPNQTAWSPMSDSTKKENFLPVNGEEVLRKIKTFNLRSWNFKDSNPKTDRHYGPMAQEFFGAFGHDDYGVIGNDTTINSSDFDGINLIAIQALIKRTDELTTANQKVTSLETDIGAFKEEIEKQNITIEEQSNLILNLRKELSLIQDTVNVLLKKYNGDRTNAPKLTFNSEGK